MGDSIPRYTGQIAQTHLDQVTLYKTRSQQRPRKLPALCRVHDEPRRDLDGEGARARVALMPDFEERREGPRGQCAADEDGREEPRAGGDVPQERKERDGGHIEGFTRLVVLFAAEGVVSR